ncbi:hypothetical protein T12_12905 [Trichinella patagoniensis]|uniref:Uncharacterized protein n=1 Tax=Trichinella patagoniensis TaxID=990121 RepID=A0A0V0ZU91_9BILA|nr:hypothetical protein T12_12905 [Trichinella patagoniensis]
MVSACSRNRPAIFSLVSSVQSVTFDTTVITVVVTLLVICTVPPHLLPPGGPCRLAFFTSSITHLEIFLLGMNILYIFTDEVHAQNSRKRDVLQSRMVAGVSNYPIPPGQKLSCARLRSLPSFLISEPIADSAPCRSDLYGLTYPRPL